jgi:tetratricopeptide (TPR) repeat protein
MRFSRLVVALLLVSALASPGCGGGSDAAKHYNAGAKLGEQSRWEEAIQDYDEAIRLDPKLAQA